MRYVTCAAGNLIRIDDQVQEIFAAGAAGFRSSAADVPRRVCVRRRRGGEDHHVAARFVDELELGEYHLEEETGQKVKALVGSPGTGRTLKPPIDPGGPAAAP
jgi:hypothetical protein